MKRLHQAVLCSELGMLLLGGNIAHGDNGAGADRSVAGNSSPDVVVLLHGFGRTKFSMVPVARALSKRGYHVVNITYHSWWEPLEKLADDRLDGELRGEVPKDGRIHFVTHSMGGILLREYLARHSLPRLGRVVMLAPPNQGSECADWFKRNRFTRWITGPNLTRLGTAIDDLPRSLGPARFDLGVIAGDRSIFGALRPKLPRGDGKVSVQSTRIDGMSDFLVIHATHTFMMWRRDTLDQIATFLESGKFQHPPSQSQHGRPAPNQDSRRG